MPLAPWTVRLGYLSSSLPGWWLLHTARPGKQTVLRDVVLTQGSAAPLELSVAVAIPTGVVYLVRVTIASNQTYHLDIRQVLEPGDKLYLYFPTTALVGCLATGYEFAGVGPPGQAPIGPTLTIGT